MLYWANVPEELPEEDTEYNLGLQELQAQPEVEGGTWWPVVVWQFANTDEGAWACELFGTVCGVSCIVQLTECPLVAWPISPAAWMD